MSLEYYTALVKRTPMLPEDARADARNSPAGQQRLLIEAFRLMLVGYWQMHEAGKTPHGINADDTDEAISIAAAAVPGMLAAWDPDRGALTTYLYKRLPWLLLRTLYKLHAQSERYATGVFNPEEIDHGLNDEGAWEDQGGAKLADDSAIHSLPICDLVYAEPPLGMMDPAQDYALSERLALMQKLAERSITPREYAKFLGRKDLNASELSNIYKRRDVIAELLESATPAVQ